MEGAEVAALARQHKKLTWQRIGIVAGLTLIAAVAFIISNFVGAIDISPGEVMKGIVNPCLLYTSPSPRDVEESRMPSSA